jgi:hypothetical protein
MYDRVGYKYSIAGFLLKLTKADVDSVDLRDFAIFAENWLKWKN